jgi:hypothetical protein
MRSVSTKPTWCHIAVLRPLARLRKLDASVSKSSGRDHVSFSVNGRRSRNGRAGTNCPGQDGPAAIPAVADLLTDNFLQVTATGLRRTKAETVKTFTDLAGTPIPPSVEQPNAAAPKYAVQWFGDTAVVTHYSEPYPGVVMHVFVKQQGRWKMAAWTAALEAKPEFTINQAGYELMAKGKLREAIDLFKLNVQFHPESWSVHDSLGEAYAKAGETGLAIENYSKSVQLNPKNGAGVAALKKLKGK